MGRVDQAARDRVGQAGGGRWIGRREVAVLTVGQPRGNAADGKGRGRNASEACLGTDQPEWFRPHTRDNQEVRIANKPVDTLAVEPAGETHANVVVQGGGVRGKAFPFSSIGT